MGGRPKRRARKAVTIAKMVLTPETHKHIVASLQAGNYLTVAAQAAGIEPRVVREWMRIGAEEHEAREKGQKPDRDKDAIVEFWVDAKKAEAGVEQRQVLNVTKAGKEDWRASAFFLERKSPKRWGQKVQVTIDAFLDDLLDRLERGLTEEEYAKVSAIVLSGEDAGEAEPEEG